MADRVLAILTFAVFYFGGLFGATELQESAIIHDAVVGPPIVAVIYAAMFMPAAVAAAGTLFLARCSLRLRLGLAAAFGIVVGPLMHALFIASQSEIFGEAVRRADLKLLAAANVALIGTFIAIGAVADRNYRRRHDAETAA